MTYGIIYQAYNIRTGKVYIGQTTQTLKRRRQRHISAAMSGKYSYYFANALANNPNEFIWTTLCECDSESSLNIAEESFIRAFNATDNRVGYNNSYGGDNRRKTPETCLKQSESLRGHVLSQETKEKISKAHCGKSLSKETKQKISSSIKGRKNTPESILNMQLAAQSRSNLSAEIVIDIRFRYSNSEKPIDIQRLHNISSSTFWRIVSNKTWKHV